MKKIKNPYNPTENRCFACSVSNPIGLKLTFEESEKYLHATWTPSELYQGYHNLLHGGIISTLLDEIGAWCVNVKIGTAGVTSELKVKFLKPVWLNKGDILLKAEIIEKDKKSVQLKCYLYDSTQTLCAEAETVFFIYPEEIARKRLKFPGKEAFYYE
jgi:uncharacterized protein (TIGR00369 family)